MDLLIILTYVAIAWSIFKIFKIPVNKWTVPTAALGGVFIVSALILLMNYNHPSMTACGWARNAFPRFSTHGAFSPINASREGKATSDFTLGSQVWLATD